MYQSIVLPVLVIVIGFASIAGRISGNYQLERIGYAYSASPLPIPFTDPRGFQETFAHTYKVIASTEHSGDVVTQLTHVPLSGPHKRAVTFIQALIFSSKNNTLVNNALNYAFCGDNRPLLKAINIERTEKVVIKIESNTKGLAGAWEHTVLCKS